MMRLWRSPATDVFPDVEMSPVDCVVRTLFSVRQNEGFVAARCWLVLPRATFVTGTNFVSWTQKLFLKIFRNDPYVRVACAAPEQNTGIVRMRRRLVSARRVTMLARFATNRQHRRTQCCRHEVSAFFQSFVLTPRAVTVTKIDVVGISRVSGWFSIVHFPFSLQFFTIFFFYFSREEACSILVTKWRSCFGV